MNNTELIGDVYERFKGLESTGFDYQSFCAGWIDGRVDLIEYGKEKLLSDIESVLERNLLGRDDDNETVEQIIELFKESKRTNLKWHFK